MRSIEVAAAAAGIRYLAKRLSLYCAVHRLQYANNKQRTEGCGVSVSEREFTRKDLVIWDV